VKTQQPAGGATNAESENTPSVSDGRGLAHQQPQLFFFLFFFLSFFLFPGARFLFLLKTPKGWGIPP
jgi:hypothetical protein